MGELVGGVDAKVGRCGSSALSIISTWLFFRSGLGTRIRKTKVVGPNISAGEGRLAYSRVGYSGLALGLRCVDPENPGQTDLQERGGCTCIPRTRPRSQFSLVSRVARAWIRPQEKSAGLTAKQRRAPRRTGMRLLLPRAQWLSGGQSARCLSRLTAPLAGMLLEGGYWKRADRSDHLCMQGTRFPPGVC